MARRAGWATRLCLLMALAIGAASMGPAIASAPNDPAGSTRVDREDLVALQKECAEQTARLKGALEQLSEDDDQTTPKLLVDELELWERLELIAAQRQSTLEDLADVRRRLQLAKKSPTGLEAAHEELQRSHSFLKLDEVRDELLATRAQAVMLELELKSERSLLIDAKEQLEDVEQDRRLALEAGSAAAGAGRQQMALSLAELRCRVSRCQTDLHRERTEALKQNALLAHTKINDLEARIHSMSEGVRFSQDELEKRLGLIDKVEQDIREQLDRAEQRLRLAIHERPEGDPSSTSRDMGVQTAHEETQLLQQILTEVGGIRGYWRWRYRLANGDFKPGEPDEWLQSATAAKRQIDSLSEKVRLRMAHWQTALSSVRRQDVGELSDQEAAELDDQAAELERAIEFYSTTQVLVVSGQRMYERFVSELEQHLDRMTWAEFAGRVGAWASAAWTFEITSIDDRPITVSKIVCGMAMLLLGYWVARTISITSANRILPRCGLSPTAIAPLRTLMFYGLLVAFAFLALDVVNVPLTVFAFMGGAIAIGIGFGSQNILNNFISGLILLVERPIRIGDLVNIEGIDANVEHIGARSTRVRTGANLEILVPNSKFLENNVTNWTLSDTRTRTSVSVGVAYGTPVKPVLELLESTVLSHPKVLPNPAPIVLFKDFGDSSLAFEVHFWIHMKRMMDAARVQSDVRAEIDDRFRAEGIVISFPQRDVHLDIQTPIEVRMSEPAAARIGELKRHEAA